MQNHVNELKIEVSKNLTEKKEKKEEKHSLEYNKDKIPCFAYERDCDYCDNCICVSGSYN